jgi:hypothetical protein
MGKLVRGYTGRFVPKNSSKYLGDPTNIIYRSLWERRVMVYLDDEDNILKWSSENVIVPYYSPVDQKMHKYYVDFYIEAKTKTGVVKKMLWEIKPKIQCEEPVKKTKVTKRYLLELATYAVNQAKWEAARAWAHDRGMQFAVITEDHLGIPR